MEGRFGLLALKLQYEGGGDGVEGFREARKYAEKILLLKFTFLEPISLLMP